MATTYGNLCDYATGETLRPATQAEARESARVALQDGGAGVIDVGGVACYVEAIEADDSDRDDEEETEAKWEVRREGIVNDLFDALGDQPTAPGFDLWKMIEAAVERNPNVTLAELESMWADVLERCAADDDGLTRVEGVDL